MLWGLNEPLPLKNIESISPQISNQHYYSNFEIQGLLIQLWDDFLKFWANWRSAYKWQSSVFNRFPQGSMVWKMDKTEDSLLGLTPIHNSCFPFLQNMSITSNESPCVFLLTYGLSKAYWRNILFSFPSISSLLQIYTHWLGWKEGSYTDFFAF